MHKLKHAVFINICFSIEQKMGNYETKSLDWTNGFFFNKNTRLVSFFTAFDFYELLYLLATILSLDNVVALHKKPHSPA